MRATRPTILILLDLVTLTILAKITNYEAPHYAIFSSLSLGPCLIIATLFSNAFSL
jgi:hypothetical protein